jgi:hypothetical protein
MNSDHPRRGRGLRRAGLHAAAVLALVQAGLAAGEIQSKAAIEVAHESRGWLLRIRPYDYSSPSGNRRIDLLLGRRWGAWNAYLYGKADNRERFWLGIRLDTHLMRGKGRMALPIQFRAFLGLNRQSAAHIYLISNPNFRLGPGNALRPGLLVFGKKENGNDPVLYLGPAVTFRLARFLGARLSYGPNLLGEGGLLYLKMSLSL